jgi:hypothetical protein
MHGENVDRSTVGCWARRFSGKAEHCDIHDLQRIGRLHAAVVERVENVIMAGTRVSVKQLSLQLDTEEASVCRILEQLGYMKDPAATDRFTPGAIPERLFRTFGTV